MAINANIVDQVNAALTRMRIAENAGGQAALVLADGGVGNPANAYHQLETQADALLLALKNRRGAVAGNPNLAQPLIGLIAQAQLVTNTAKAVRAAATGGGNPPITAAALGELESGMTDLKNLIDNYNVWEQAHTAGTVAMQAQAASDIADAKQTRYETSLETARTARDESQGATMKAAGIAIGTFVGTATLGFAIFTPSAQSAFIDNPGRIAQGATTGAMAIYLIAMVALVAVSMWNVAKKHEAAKADAKEVSNIIGRGPQ